MSGRCVAMILAGGRGKRLGSLTDEISKEVLPFCTNYHVIDFPLSNCINAGIDTIGILSQYNAESLHNYINGLCFFDKQTREDVFLLPPGQNGECYSDGADALYKNLSFIEAHNPDDVFVLSGDHIYSMDFENILQFHRKNKAEMTMAVNTVRFEDAYRYGMVSIDEKMRVRRCQHGIPESRNVLVPMGVSVYKWKKLKEVLKADNEDSLSGHNFVRDIIPRMVANRDKVLSYFSNSYWQDVGTLSGLWQANMDVLGHPPAWRFLKRHAQDVPFWAEGPVKVDQRGEVYNSMVSENCTIRGIVENSVISDGVVIEDGAIVANSVVMENAYIGHNTIVNKAIVGQYAHIMNGAYIGDEQGSKEFVDNKVCSNGISLIAPGIYIDAGIFIRANSHVSQAFVSFGAV